MDRDHIPDLVRNGTDPATIAEARRIAKIAHPSFPRLGCAAYLSALLALSGIDVQMTLGAGKLAHVLERQRGWKLVRLGKQQPGDIGVAFDNDKKIAGSDHVYLVLEAIDADEMQISDNQDVRPHRRFVSGRGKTPTEYFLRA